MAMVYNHGDVIIRFTNASFNYGVNRPILDAVNFSVRERAKITLMGQNGAGKSTIFKLILGELQSEEGAVNVRRGATIALAAQVVKKEDLEKSVIEFFQGAFREKVYDIEPRIKKALDAINVKSSLAKKINQFSGGEQARLLLACALIQNPDILLLDEPTNNLDAEGIKHLTTFLIEYQKTVLVISHDAQFLNAFTHGVLYIDIFKKKVDQFVGDYFTVVLEIERRIDEERRENVRLHKDISNRKEQMNFFAQKGGHMRDVARKMREAIHELESQLIETTQEDKTITQFRIPAPEIAGPIITITAAPIVKNHKTVIKKVHVVLKREQALLVQGPNGIGKTTFLKKIVAGAKGSVWGDGVTVGYYAQDFSGLNETQTVYQALVDATKNHTEEGMRSVAARFLFTNDLLKNKIESLSAGQKGLLCFAQFVLQEPALLVLDEPTNHINYRHLPAIAEALHEFQGALILVSHKKDFVAKIKMDETIDLGKI